MSIKKIRTINYFLIAIFFAEISFAGPPYQTDDPEPLELGQHELYIAYLQTRTQDNQSEIVPLIELNIGAAKDLQLGIALPYVQNHQSQQLPQQPPQRLIQRGLGDIEFSAKYRLIEETENLPMISFFPSVAIPSGDADRGLGNGKAEFFLPFWLQKNWGDWQTNFGGGYRINQAVDAKNSWFLGLQLQKKVSKSLTMGGEVFHSTEETSGEGDLTGFNFGLVDDLDQQNHLLFSVGLGVESIQSSHQFLTYVGYQLTW